MGIFILFFLATNILQSEATATLEIMLVSFENEGGEEYYGYYCDGSSGYCDHRFEIYLYDQNITLIQALYTTSFDEKDTIVFPQNQIINNIYNPIVQKFATWPGSVLFKVIIYDSDSNEDDHVDTIKEYITLKPALSKKVSVGKAMFFSGSRRFNYYYTSKKTQLGINVHLYCDANFFGENCDIECLPMDNINGHYTCDSTTGAIVCRPGWKDVSTNCTFFSKNCLDNRCQNNAICVETNSNYTCTCLLGFTGLYCETNIDECLSSPCINGGKCKDFINDFFCYCPNNFAGKKCEITACMQNNPCLNEGVCYGNSSCLCQLSYYGEKCENAKIVAINESLTIHSTNQSFTDGKLIIVFLVFALILLGIIVFFISLRLYRRSRNSRTIRDTEYEVSFISDSAPCSISTPSPKFNFDKEPKKGGNKNRINFPIMTSPEQNEYTIMY